MIFNVMERDYHLMGSFTDVGLCKEFASSDDRAFWVGVFPMNEPAKAVPMWEAYDFVYNFPHRKG